MRVKRNFARIAAAGLVAAAALATGATEAVAAPQYWTLTEANQGQRLAVQDHKAVTVVPQTGNASQQFELLFPGSAGSSEPGFGSAFQLKNKSTGQCLRDNGNGAQVTEVTCFPNPSVNSAQLWQQHTSADLVLGGKNYYFVYNRNSDRLLTRAPFFGSPTAVNTAPRQGALGSANSKLQLWDIARVS
jgi:hypothetical protein